MSNGFCYFAERSPGFSLSELAASLRTIGVQLRNSNTGLLTALNDEGDQVAVTETELDQSLHGSNPVTFQLWFSDDTDIICSFRRISDDIVVHAYGLDGLDMSERERTVEWSINRFKQKANESNAVLLVVDRYGISWDYDWDAVVRGEVEAPERLPEVVGANIRAVRLSGDRFVGYERQSFESAALFVRSGKAS